MSTEYGKVQCMWYLDIPRVICVLRAHAWWLICMSVMCEGIGSCVFIGGTHVLGI